MQFAQHHQQLTWVYSKLDCPISKVPSEDISGKFFVVFVYLIKDRSRSLQCGPSLFLNVICKEIFRCVVADAMNREKHLFEKKWIWQWTMKHQLESAKKYFLSVSKCCTHHIDLDWREARHISSIYLPPIKWRIESCEHCSILLEFARVC